MGTRDEEGNVAWKCSKCNKVFKQTCGQYFWRIGTIVGPWPEQKVTGIVKGKPIPKD